ncbi:MAG: hypothetical protein AVDCRST_MAG79-811 [uncultured Thermoleophilia bacterium]|uniref:Motility protein n=1 Tax=uncultured Thermoleophilia bacterium TaxID=1497501 RepID=A0A6J4TQD9_9ACTN|nr:MAG: hypothetical protein AVDCRST_MAG79-811 [uncultured Thermoleophilia bacterium]
MDAVTSTLQAQSRTVATEVSARMLRAQLDDQQTRAAQLLAVLPSAPSSDPGRGGRVDTYA